MFNILLSVLLFSLFRSRYLQPMHDYYDIRQEQLNKASIMSSKTFLEKLLEMFKVHVVRLLVKMETFLIIIINLSIQNCKPELHNYG